MSESKFKRFSRFHRIVHWLIALPYMLLLGSGALMVLHHLGWAELVSFRTLAVLHRWTGIAFAGVVAQLIFTTIVSGQWRVVRHDLRSWLSWKPRDVHWLMVVPFNALLPKRIPLPPVGRFNAGQKLHGLYIVLAVTGLTVTGLMMIWIPGWLTVWRIHLLLFLGAAAFLGIHLFLGLINPSTRKALSGMFTGHVKHSYVREHHPLDLDPSHHATHPHAAVSVIAVLLVGLVLAAAGSVWWIGPGHVAVTKTFQGPWKTAAFFPGPLTSVHATKIKAQNCTACHTHSGPVTNAGCLSCHREISQALLARSGFHGKLTADCSTCHVEHHGTDADLRVLNVSSFNHDQARFRLDGAHRALDCSKCHLQHSPTPGQTRFIGLHFGACNDCHANPHRDMPQADCKSCHSEQGWTGRQVLFVHNRDSKFKLDAVHEVLSCTACHPRDKSVGVFRGTPTACAACHTQVADAMVGKIGTIIAPPDPHNGRVACVDCHKPGLRFQTASQYSDECARCHDQSYRALFFNWQKSLDAREQAAKLRLVQSGRTATATTQPSLLIRGARIAGMHNVQAAQDAFESVGR